MSAAAAASMTKDELRSALSDAGVSSPSSARKDELMALYESVQSAPPMASPPGGVDFSADDEEEVALATLKKSSIKSKSSLNKTSEAAVDTSMVLGDFDVSQLTDDQLCEALIERQIQVGPIVDSTRKLYRRKLVAAMREESSTVNGSVNGGQNGTTENGHNNEQVELQNGDFSADDEEILNGGGGEESADQEGEPEEEEIIETEEDEDQPSVVVKKAATPVVADEKQQSTLASIRKRFIGPDSTDAAVTASSNGERFTPTPRRSIHSYKVTETSRQTLTKSKDGTVTHDFDYKKETSESKGVLGTGSRGKLATVLRLLPGFFLILLFAVLAYYVYTKRK